MRVHFVHEGRESLGIEYLSSALQAAGHEVSLTCDQGLFGPDDNVFSNRRLARFFRRRARSLERILSARPDVVAFSVFTNNYPWALDLASQVKDALDVPVVFGGIHPTLVPDRVIRERAVDYVLAGEGEEAFPELLSLLESERDPHGMANLWTKRTHPASPPPMRPAIVDLDSIPFPDKSLFEKTVNYRDDYLILTSRGCPCNCSYCCESFMNRLYGGRFFRRRSVENVMSELRTMKERYRFREVMFNDAIFFTDKAWLRGLLEAFHREIGTRFRCFGQVRFLDEEVAAMLKAAGCYAIEFGVQTVNERVRREVLRRGESNEQNTRAFEICDSFDLVYDVDHMFGLPTETPADHEEAARFYAGRRKLNRVKCHNLVYFPRLAVTARARELGLLTGDDVEAIESGRVGDFFHEDSIRSPDEKREKKSSEVLLKLLPLLGGRGVEFLLRKPRRRRALRFLPGILVNLLQVLGAVRKRDYRFFLYFRYYPLRVRRALSLPREVRRRNP